MQDHTWILDILGDIGAYAELNQLPELEKAVNHAQVMAVAESILKLDATDNAAVSQALLEYPASF